MKDNKEETGGNIMVNKRDLVAKQFFSDHTSENKLLQGVLRIAHLRTVKQRGLTRETRHGKILATAAKAARIKHFIRRSFHDTHRNNGTQRDKDALDMRQYMRSWLACNHLPAGFLQ
ncbi:MAG: hypothetical protein DCC43_03695 [Candidatus Brocadia sp.]|nr:hypothetical protein [Candidatus Brocadia sp. AMX3]MDG5995581.1 hypothetical protein [Candidatus Brocadia sp.]RIK02226.1 MAG: hypothetical protein DCC43_03695 [Candidatus Brocadia sp.]